MEQYIKKSALVAEIEKLHGNPFYRMAIKDVLAIIDSLQKEPVSSIWHDASEEPEEGKQLVFSYKKQYYAGRIYKDEFGRTLAYDGKTAIELGLLDNWAYLDDLLKLDNPCKIGKNLQEPVSEDLEKTAELYTLDDSIKPWRNLTKEAFKAGAKWQLNRLQKQKDGK